MVDQMTPPEDEPVRSRLDDEVLDILYQSDRPPTAMERCRASMRQWWWRTKAGVGRGRTGVGLPPIAYLIASLVFAVLAVRIADASPLFGRLLALAAVACLAAPFFIAFRGRTSASSPKRWRGRDIDLGPGGRR